MTLDSHREPCYHVSGAAECSREPLAVSRVLAGRMLAVIYRCDKLATAATVEFKSHAFRRGKAQNIPRLQAIPFLR